MSMLAMLVLITIIIFITKSAGFTAYDCDQPERVKTYSMLDTEVCSPAKETRIMKTIQAEIIQLKQERYVPVFKCRVVESRFSQYCGVFSRAGSVRYHQFRDPFTVEAQHCRMAQLTGRLNIRGRLYNATVGTTTSHTTYVTGSMDKDSNCEVGSLNIGESILKNQVTQIVFEISLGDESGFLNEVTKKIKMPSANLEGPFGDRALFDSFEGTYVWDPKELSCPEGLVPLYRGPLKVLTNDSNTITNSLAIVEDLLRGQVAGIELHEASIMCGSTAYQTNVKNLMVIVHPDEVKSFKHKHADRRIQNNLKDKLGIFFKL